MHPGRVNAWQEPRSRNECPKLVTTGVLLWSLLALSACDSDAPMGGTAPTDMAGSTSQATTTVAPATETSATTIFIDTNGSAPNPDQSEPRPAWWTLDPMFTPTPESMSLPIIVVERACASGIPSTGRIAANAEYLRTEVRITVIVNTVGGDVTCPANLPEPFTVQLEEPLGDRQIVGENPPPN